MPVYFCGAFLVVSALAVLVDGHPRTWTTSVIVGITILAAFYTLVMSGTKPDEQEAQRLAAREAVLERRREPPHWHKEVRNAGLFPAVADSFGAYAVDFRRQRPFC